MPQNTNDIRYRWWQVHPRLAAALLVVVLAAIAVGIYYLWPTTPKPPAPPPPPVYVTDGAYAFSDDLGPVEKMIKTENDRVVAQGVSYVSIAVLDVMRPQPGIDVVNEAFVRHNIEGAHIAQLAANQPVSGEPQVPQIRLLLGDEGSGENSWRELATDLESRVGGTENLVAVTGLGASIDNTRRLVEELASRKIAMVGALITADDFKQIQGMVRVAPTNSDEAQAAVSYLRNTGALATRPRILLVQDQNPADTYAQSLGVAFTTSLGDPTIMAPVFPYDSRLANAATVLDNHADRVCAADKVTIVYFAGRSVDLIGLLNGLAGRRCRDTPLTVVTGDDASQLSGQTLWQNKDANLTILFTALAHPDMWLNDQLAASPTISKRFGSCATCFGTLFPDDTLDDGGAIMSHDAVQTAVVAIRADPDGPPPSASGVAQELPLVSVPGASGYLCFDTDHNPINKAIPIMAHDKDGQPSYKALSSATGTPPTTDQCGSVQ